MVDIDFMRLSSSQSLLFGSRMAVAVWLLGLSGVVILRREIKGYLRENLDNGDEGCH